MLAFVENCVLTAALPIPEMGQVVALGRGQEGQWLGACTVLGRVWILDACTQSGET